MPTIFGRELWAWSFLGAWSPGKTRPIIRRRANREVQTVAERVAEKGLSRGVSRGAWKRRLNPWTRGKKGAQTSRIREGRSPWSANRELGTFNLENSSVSVHSLHFNMVCAPLSINSLSVEISCDFSPGNQVFQRPCCSVLLPPSFFCHHRSELIWSGGPKGGHLKGGHLKMGFRSAVRTWKWDFALQFALDTSILTALSKAIPQGKHRLDRKGAV